MVGFLKKEKKGQKVFCIGLNKTGTTTLKFSLGELGYRVGNERVAKGLLDAWASRNFDPIIEYCDSADAFQDSPFSFPFTYVALDQAFPGGKFILSVRNNADEWVDSIIRFHGKLWADGRVPTKFDLMNAVNVTKGRPWKVNRLLFDTPEEDPYNRKILKDFYHNHIRMVEYYFKKRENDLLKINLANKESYRVMCEFLGKTQQREEFPVLNQSKDTTR